VSYKIPTLACTANTCQLGNCYSLNLSVIIIRWSDNELSKTALRVVVVADC